MRKLNSKKTIQNVIAPLSAFAAVIALGVPNANAQTSPVLYYSFPASWNGTGSTISDQSSAGNDGFYDGSLSLDTAIPSGATGGSQSVNTTAGGILTSATGLLNNSSVAAAGGFTLSLAFNWNGTDSSSFGHTEKLIDYAGTESLQLVTTSGSASLQMAFADNSGNETVATSTSILPNTWYTVSLTFNTAGNSLDGSGDITGLASMDVNGVLVGEAEATKGTFGDSLDRPIGIGQLGANFGYLVGFKGDEYDPSVSLGVAAVPEPSSTALLGAFGGLMMAWKLRRRKA